MTFTVIDSISLYTIDIETIDELFALGHDRYGDAPMTIDWANMTITVTFGE
jgi:hypothetical protein